MLALLKLADARMGEPSTWASLAGVLVLLHINVDPGLLAQFTLWGAVASAVLGVVLGEAGNKPAAQIASDALAAFFAAVKAMPPPAKTALAFLAVCGLALGLSACSGGQITTALQTPPGQLFCAIQTQGGGTIIAGLISDASSAVPGAAPIAVLATNAGEAAVNADCAKAAVATGAVSAVPVSPPAAPAAAPQVAIPSPASPVTS